MFSIFDRHNNNNNIRKNIDIVSPKRLVNGYTVLPLEEHIAKAINCYAYALGVCSARENYLFEPGFTYGERFTGRDSLISNISKDLKNLGLKFRIIKLNYPIHLKRDEYLIKVFCSDEPNCFSKYGDFHFIRKDLNCNKWFHKWGWTDQPEFIKWTNSSLKSIGKEPTIITLFDSNNEKFTYTPVCYFAIKYSKKRN